MGTVNCTRMPGLLLVLVLRLPVLALVLVLALQLLVLPPKS